jgi:hypothetical protein
MPLAPYLSMHAVSRRITQRGLGTPEDVETAQIDATWDDAPPPPVACPSSRPPSSRYSYVAPRQSGRMARVTLCIGECANDE